MNDAPRSTGRLAALWLLPLVLAAPMLSACRVAPTNLTAIQSDTSMRRMSQRASQPPLPSPAPAAIASRNNAEIAQVAYHSPSLPSQAWTGAPAAVCPHCSPSAPANGDPSASYTPHAATWNPPAIYGSWPQDEYLFDGGDKPRKVHVDRDWMVQGLDIEDTVAHFDTIDGRVIVQPSNRVSIYAPRFAAVRKVDGLSLHHQQQQPNAADLTTSLAQANDLQIATTAVQPQQPVTRTGRKTLSAFRERLRDVGLDNFQSLVQFTNRYKPYEDLQIIHNGTFKASEKARLADGIEAAQVWTGNQGVQIFVDSDQAVLIDGSVRPQETIGGGRILGQSRLSVVKIASSPHARPGETIDFTLRFDNVGDETIGNVTIVDNLTPRLEYVQGSAQCSLKAEFLTETNERESLVLRWEITDPIPAGQGGVLRFSCRVR